MKATIVWLLVGLNLLLAAVLVARVTPETPAHAQAARRPSEYLMLPGKAAGAPASVVYVIDTTNAQLSAMMYDESRKRVETINAIDLDRFLNDQAPLNNTPNRGGR